ncbi:MAG: glycosyltransferase family protein [Deltaproteobacteria bacterium]|nr:glycosyltransferase family protein [Deltaproteobacteria bacterium]
MKVVAIVQARIGSTRLPGKVLMNLAGKPMICFMLDRVAKSSAVDEIILATGDGKDNDELARVVSEHGYSVFRGSEDDVLARYTGAAKSCSADIIVRLTGDCPLIDPEVIDQLVTIFIEGKYDYVTNVKPPTWPDGFDVSAFSSALLNDANLKAERKSDREHVVPWMWRMTPLEGGCAYRGINVSSNNDLSLHRWTVDELSDYEFVKRIVSEIPSDKDINFTLEDILKVLANKPELMEINRGIIRDAGYKQDLLKEDGSCV